MLVENGRILETTKIQFVNTSNPKEGFGYVVAGAVSLKELTIFVCRTVNNWYNSNIANKEEEPAPTFKACAEDAIDCLGGVLNCNGSTVKHGSDILYQVDYTYNRDETDTRYLTISSFTYINKQTQNFVRGSVYGYYMYNHLNHHVWCRQEMFFFDTSVDDSGKLRDIKQYVVGIIPDAVDKQLLAERDRALSIAGEDRPKDK